MREKIQELSIKQKVVMGIGVGTTIFTGVIYAIGPEKVGGIISEIVKDPCLKEDTQELVQECKDKRAENQGGPIYIDW